MQEIPVIQIRQDGWLLVLDATIPKLSAGPILQITGQKSKATVSAPFRASPTSRPKPGDNSDASISPDDSSEISDMESACSISIKNICSTVGLYEIVEAISEFGKVTGALFGNASNGLKCRHIKFESVDSSRQGVLAGKISVGSQEYPVQPLDAVDVLAVRIKNINQNTSERDIHRICNLLVIWWG